MKPTTQLQCIQFSVCDNLSSFDTLHSPLCFMETISGILSEESRLLTFPTCYTAETSEDLARYGFSWKYDGTTRGYVQCEFCGIVIDDYKDHMNAAVEHMIRNRHCAMVNNIECGNIQWDRVGIENNAEKLVNDQPASNYESPLGVRPIHVYDDGVVVRLDTYPEDWQYCVSKHELARYGFKWEGTSDKVKCEFCELVIENWKKSDLVALEHKLYEPNCTFINKLKYEMKSEAIACETDLFSDISSCSCSSIEDEDTVDAIISEPDNDLNETSGELNDENESDGNVSDEEEDHTHWRITKRSTVYTYLDFVHAMEE
jgi:Inhibitor of Apoptosis domain